MVRSMGLPTSTGTTVSSATARHKPQCVSIETTRLGQQRTANGSPTSAFASGAINRRQDITAKRFMDSFLLVRDWQLAAWLGMLHRSSSDSICLYLIFSLE